MTQQFCANYVVLTDPCDSTFFFFNGMTQVSVIDKTKRQRVHARLVHTPWWPCDE